MKLTEIFLKRFPIDDFSDTVRFVDASEVELDQKSLGPVMVQLKAPDGTDLTGALLGRLDPFMLSFISPENQNARKENSTWLVSSWHPRMGYFEADLRTLKTLQAQFWRIEP